MDIHRINNSRKSIQTPSNRVEKDEGFIKVFNQKLSEVTPTPLKTTHGPKADILDHGDKILNLLDDYAKGLADPRKSLKDMKPLVEIIEREVTSLDTKASEEVRKDPQLMGLIKDLTVTANVAVFKYYRGDYI